MRSVKSVKSVFPHFRQESFREWDVTGFWRKWEITDFTAFTDFRGCPSLTAGWPHA
jgi:hypothetical protein